MSHANTPIRNWNFMFHTFWWTFDFRWVFLAPFCFAVALLPFVIVAEPKLWHSHSVFYSALTSCRRNCFFLIELKLQTTVIYGYSRIHQCIDSWTLHSAWFTRNMFDVRTFVRRFKGQFFHGSNPIGFWIGIHVIAKYFIAAYHQYATKLCCFDRPWREPRICLLLLLFISSRWWLNDFQFTQRRK